MSNIEEESKRLMKVIMLDGSFDGIRKKVVEALKQDDALKQYAFNLMNASKTVSSANLQVDRDRKKLLEALLLEIKDKLLEKASRMAWDLLSKPDSSIAQDIDLKVHESLCAIYEEKAKEAQQASTSDAAQPTAGTATTSSDKQPSVPPPQSTPQAGWRPQQQQAQQLRPPPKHYGQYDQNSYNKLPHPPNYYGGFR